MKKFLKYTGYYFLWVLSTLILGIILIGILAITGLLNNFSSDNDLINLGVYCSKFTGYVCFIAGCFILDYHKQHDIKNI